MEDMTVTTLPQAIKYYRTIVIGESQVTMAAAIGVSVMTIYRWESGKVLPHRYNLTKMARYFGIPSDTFHKYLTAIPPSNLSLEEI